MKKLSQFIMLYFFLFLLNSGCVYSVARYDGPYEGRVVDAETGRPMEGVVV